MCWATISDDLFTDDFFKQIQQRYGEDRLEDFSDWRDTISEGSTLSDMDRLHLANQFANRRIRFVSDNDHWQKSDYWATPLESLGSKGGDCEDFAIFKYFTLKAMGVDESKMRLMYVRALLINEPHMVLIYFENPKAMPLVLDNLKTQILPASQRRDLKPVYSFNGQGLWLAKAQGLGSNKPTSGGTKNWTDLINRIENGE
ncbi:MAG: transglutaminase [Shewanella vesiculosa]|nr:transglutaminase [Shewanella vesiculosa]NCQ44890.1 transglutaminase [Shewanella frigidimarina]PIQ01155.1 MAG: transglutaminase [Shewanella sp. CG18_big_fil_WC_8_21_14_2_50_42_11]PIX73130.1 MAG: transglutaminase [Shewanella sp. CG_4_10_14_3_um_filter_42_91]PIY66562.1 MAG: transglutaminase [Shewanella sp. CG_4_10_14_0_8_um_filter_42_13]PJB93557.1 MAG: transglutaminase [Shewanella sp. CG_4_9_14_0_8_um_filter_42_14]